MIQWKHNLFLGLTKAFPITLLGPSSLTTNHMHHHYVNSTKQITPPLVNLLKENSPLSTAIPVTSMMQAKTHLLNLEQFQGEH